MFKKGLRNIYYYFRSLSSFLRKQPGVLIIGAQKAGTTTLFSQLSNHPNLRGSIVKQVHYYDLNYNKGIAWYKGFFSTSNAAIGFEATPYYIFHPHVPGRVFRDNPNMKLIVLLRDPVSRCYSHYQHNVRHGLETRSLEKALEDEIRFLGIETEKMLSDSSYKSLIHMHQSYFERGVYCDQIESWFKYFPRNQFLIIGTEDMASEPQRIDKLICEFLELPFQPMSERAVWKNKGEYDKMSPEIRETLQKRYEPHNQRLQSLLGRRFEWM